MKRIIYLTFFFLLVSILYSCTSKPNDIDDTSKTTIRYKFPKILSYSALSESDDGSIVVRMLLSIPEKEFYVFGKCSPELYDDLADRKMLRKIKLEKIDNQLLIKKVDTELGVYGAVQYYTGYSWLVKFCSYNTALNLSLIPVILVFLIIFILGAVFIEF